MSQLPFFKDDETFVGPVRLLVKESHTIFTEIPRKSELNKLDAIAISKTYRSIIHECVENLAKDILHPDSPQIKTFEALKIIWSLCEILFLDLNESAPLIILLKNWIRHTKNDLKPETNKILRELAEDNYKFSQNDDDRIYWNLFVNLIVGGDHRKALALLRSHYNFEQSAQIQLVANMIDRMPGSNQYIFHEFVNRWATWTEWCKQELETGQFSEHPVLLKVVRMFSRDLTVYDEVARDCDTWYQLMIAYLTHTDPLVRETDLADLGRKAIDIYKKNNPDKSHTPESFDDILISAFEYDLVLVISRSCDFLDDSWWFVTHFIDLIHCSNQLKHHEIVEADKLRDTFLQDYASALFQDEQLWTIGVSYLDRCTSSSSFYLEALLARVPLDIDDEESANKIMSIAKKRGLNIFAKSICTIMARIWISKSHKLDNEDIRKDEVKGSKLKAKKKTTLPSTINLSNAMHWAIRSENSSIITYVCDQYLLYYCITGKFPGSSLFEQIKRSTLENDRLAFLREYHEYKQLQQQDSDEDILSKAGNLLRALLASKLYPEFFCQQLIKDSRDLLDNSNLVLKSNQVLDMMKSIEEIKPHTQAEIDRRDISKSLVKSMAKALMRPV